MSVKVIGDFPPKYYLVESVLPKNNFFSQDDKIFQIPNQYKIDWKARPVGWGFGMT